MVIPYTQVDFSPPLLFREWTREGGDSAMHAGFRL